MTASALFSRFRTGLALTLVAGLALVALPACRLVRHELGGGKRREGAPEQAYLPAWRPGAPDLQMMVPAYTALKVERGTDFAVYYFTNPKGSESMGVYIGFAPSLFSAKKEVTKTKRSKDKINKLPVEWITWATKEGATESFHSECVIRGFFAGADKKAAAAPDQPVIHIFIVNDAKDHLGHFQKAAATLQVVP